MGLNNSYEYIIIGSGFGGAFAAYNLAKAGKEVLIVERGKWVQRDDSCWDEERLHLKDPMYRGKTSFFVDQKRGKIEEDYTDDTVGGMSTLYGAVSFRMRDDDFLGAPIPGSVEKDKNSAWPFGYDELAPFYGEAEQLLGIAGIKGEDITEPTMEGGYLHPPHDKLSSPSRKLWDAAKKLGLHPFNLPMAINFSGDYGKEKCILCSTCDHYLCKIEAKNDISVTVLPEAIKHGAVLSPNTRAVKINMSGNKAVSVDLINHVNREKATIATKHIILAGGALATPHLLLSSGIDEACSNGKLIGRYLMRHANGVVAGVFPSISNPEKMLQKQIGIPDFYYGDPDKKSPPVGVWGMIQDVSSVGKGVIKDNAPFGLKNVAGIVSDFLINLMCMAEDIPQYENRVFIDSNKKDMFGMPGLMVYHRYHDRDIQSRKALYGRAKKILRKAGALAFYSMPFETFSHAMGTCKMGTDKTGSVVDPECKIWGTDNLYVLDASVIPSGGSVSPSLTIAANSLRASKMLV